MVRIASVTSSLSLAGEGAFGGGAFGSSLVGEGAFGGGAFGSSLAGEGAFGGGGGGGGALGVTLVDPQRKRMSEYITDAAASAVFISSFSQSR